jgi:lysophospholipase L1-like esterase
MSPIANGPRARGGAVRSLLVAFVAVVVLAAPSSSLAAPSYPGSMASTGDSITRAFTTGTLPWTDNPAASWSTGTDTRVDSHYLRLLALTPRISGKSYNDARSGAKMVDLAGQMSAVISQKADYVTVLMGGNDVCTPSVSTMTSVSDFRAQFSAAMAKVTSALPRARIFVGSIPDVSQLWQLLKDNAVARLVWSTLSVCQSMLANPLSTLQADVDRRLAVRQREIDLNAVLRSVCGQYAGQCRYDNDAVFDFRFTTADVGTWDYFHPSIRGQADLAAGTWAVSFWGP